MFTAIDSYGHWPKGLNRPTMDPRKTACRTRRLLHDERSRMTTAVDQTIQLGEPVEHRGVVIAPLFPRRSPVAEYLTLDEAIPLGLRVSEVDAAGSVPELLA